MNNSRIRFASLAMAGLAALLSTGVQNKMAAPHQRTYAPAQPIRSFRFTKGGTRKTVYPDQTPAQGKAYLAAAKAKRARKAATLAANHAYAEANKQPIARYAAMGKLSHPVGHFA